MKTVINPDYRSLESELQKAVNGELTVEKVFCNRRNTVVLVTVGGKKMVVKRYRRPGIVNRIVYTLFRKSKARRAYEYAKLLKSQGFDSPVPVAYFERSQCGLFRDGYFIAEYVDYPSVHDLFYGENHLDFNSPERVELARKLSEFTFELHSKGIQPLDYNMSNILIKDGGDGKKGDGTADYGDVEFSLIDLNRMRIGKVPRLRQAMLSFFQMGTYYPDYAILLEPYAYRRGWDVETCIYHIIRHRRAADRLRHLKRLFTIHNS